MIVPLEQANPMKMKSVTSNENLTECELTAITMGRTVGPPKADRPTGSPSSHVPYFESPFPFLKTPRDVQAL